MYDEDQHHPTKVKVDRHSIGAGRDIHVGEQARVALGDYHEYRSAFAENDPEWNPPPYGSGLLLCPRCRRAHFDEEAVDCPRCHYPHREKQEARMRRAIAAAERERSLNTLAGLACMMLVIYVLLSHGVLSLGTPVAAVLAFAWGYWFLPDTLRWLDEKLKRLLGLSEH